MSSLSKRDNSAENGGGAYTCLFEVSGMRI